MTFKYRLLPCCLLLLCIVRVEVSAQSRHTAKSEADAARPIPLGRGPQLLIDDHLIAKSYGVERKVIAPQRSLRAPIVTGAVEHQNWQPFLTVLHDPDAPAHKRFRMWYNVDVVDDPRDGQWFGKTGYLESADGVRWPGFWGFSACCVTT